MQRVQTYIHTHRDSHRTIVIRWDLYFEWKSLFFVVLPPDPEPAKKYFDLPILHFESFICLVNDFYPSLSLFLCPKYAILIYILQCIKYIFEVSGFKQVNERTKKESWFSFWWSRASKQRESQGEQMLLHLTRLNSLDSTPLQNKVFLLLLNIM